MQRNVRLKACFKVIMKLFSRLNAGKSFQTSGLFVVFNYRCYFIPPLACVMEVCITEQVYVNVFEQDLIVLY